MEAPKIGKSTVDLGVLPDDYVDDDAIIEAEQKAPGFAASCTTLMSWLFRLAVPNRWPREPQSGARILRPNLLYRPRKSADASLANPVRTGT